MERPVLEGRRLDTFPTVVKRHSGAGCGGPVASFSTDGTRDEEGDNGGKGDGLHQVSGSQIQDPRVGFILMFKVLIN